MPEQGEGNQAPYAEQYAEDADCGGNHPHNAVSVRRLAMCGTVSLKTAPLLLDRIALSVTKPEPEGGEDAHYGDSNDVHRRKQRECQMSVYAKQDAGESHGHKGK